MQSDQYKLLEFFSVAVWYIGVPPKKIKNKKKYKNPILENINLLVNGLWWSVRKFVNLKGNYAYVVFNTPEVPECMAAIS